MKFIAHRGLLNGPDSNVENTPDQINLAISKGFDVEIDVWYIDSQIFLGHDRPDYLINLEFLQRNEIWAHAKNYQALEHMLENNIHCFWHEGDERVLTSRGFVWTYPNKEVFSKSVLVFLEKELNIKLENLYGVCGDYVETWKSENSYLF